MTSPTRAELLERERRLSRPAGIAAIAGALLFALSVVLQQSAFSGTSSTAEELTAVHEHSSEVLFGAVIGAIGLALFVFPLYFLFRAAQARSDRVRGALVAFAFIGPILFGLGQVVATVGIDHAADTFVKGAPAAESQPAAEAGAGSATAPSGNAAGGAGQATQTQGTQTQATPPRPQTPDTQTQAAHSEQTVTANTETTDTSSSSSSDSSDPRERFADDTVENESLVTTGASLRLPGALGLAIGLVYIGLWSMRTGLLTRFWASLGMALGVSIILLGGIGLFMLVLWFAAIGLQLAGWWPGPRPPAWEAGEAVPWMRPGDAPPAGPTDTVEGRGREITTPGDDDQDLGSEAPGDPNGSGPQDPPPRKRKRRR